MEKAPHTDRPADEESPLPATTGFVFTIGALFAVGWFLMFLLLRARW
ncbi:MAG TPA: hypothetical protein VN905_03790 [Candidatus Binatia bacterium]|nr:hypothetical protein [Candidatus Binatia bacterium]